MLTRSGEATWEVHAEADAALFASTFYANEGPARAKLPEPSYSACSQS
jgi:hypothetical protein